MKVDVSIPVDDLPVLREAVSNHCALLEGRLRHSVGYPGERKWRDQLEACERVLRAVDERKNGSGR